MLLKRIRHLSARGPQRNRRVKPANGLALGSVASMRGEELTGEKDTTIPESG